MIVQTTVSDQALTAYKFLAMVALLMDESPEAGVAVTP
jgi:hypothetical protein